MTRSRIVFILLASALWLAACNQLNSSTPDPTSPSATFPPVPTQLLSATPSLPSPATGRLDASSTPAAVAELTATPVPPSPVPAATAYPPAGTKHYLPIAAGGQALPTPTATQTPLPTPTPTIDFQAVRAQLQANNQDLGFVKIGFHVGPGGNNDGLGIWMRRLDAAGVPFFLKSVDTGGPLFEAQQIMAASNVPHTLVYRTSGQEYDVPDYSLPPAEAARQHWARSKAAFPAELDPAVVWLETINEVDAGRSAWLAEFALETAQLALADGYRWAAFGWASGEPEPADWELPPMQEFLRLAAANPDRLAIALHEYSFLNNDIGHEYPYKLGRFQQLFEICDKLGIPRPTILITEWGWEYNSVPPVDLAMRDIAWAAEMYAPYPEIKGAAIWYLGPGFAGIAHQTQPLIAPLTEFALGNYYGIPLPPDKAPINPAQFPPP